MEEHLDRYAGFSLPFGFFLISVTVHLSSDPHVSMLCLRFYTSWAQLKWNGSQSLEGPVSGSALGSLEKILLTLLTPPLRLLLCPRCYPQWYPIFQMIQCIQVFVPGFDSREFQINNSSQILLPTEKIRPRVPSNLFQTTQLKTKSIRSSIF